MNNCTFAGRLGGDAETRFTQAGKAVTNFSLAVDEYAGQGERKTTWIKCSWFGERGQKAAQYLTKGSSISVSGGISVEQWTGNDGNAHADLKLFVRDVTFLGSKQDGQSSQPRQHAPARQEAPARNAFDDSGFNDDDIPF